MGWFSSKKGDLLKAAKKGDDVAVQAALNAGADPNSKDFFDKTALMHATERGHLAIVRLLATAGAQLNAFDVDGESALSRAGVAGQLAAVQELLKLGADPNARNRHGRTPFIAMLSTVDFRPKPAHTAIAQALLAAGTDINTRDNEDRPALLVAISAESPEVVRVLLDAGADPNQAHAEATPLLLAAAVGNGPIVEALLQAGVDARALGPNGTTTLMWAAGFVYSGLWGGLAKLLGATGDTESRAQAIRALIAAGVDVNARGSEGATAVMTAALMNRPLAIRTLAAAGADLDAVSSTKLKWRDATGTSERKNLTALMMAAAEGKLEAALALIELGANPDLKASDGSTAVNIAGALGHYITSGEMMAAIKKRRATTRSSGA